MDRPSKRNPPLWWTKIVKDLERAALAARKSFEIKNTVIGITSCDTTGETSGFLIRLANGKVGYYDAKEVNQKLPVGSRIKGVLPECQIEVQEPSIESYTYEVVRENILRVPRIWLRKILNKILNGEPVTIKEDLKPFPEWVLLPIDKKEDKVLIDILYRVTRYEGLKGLARFNEI